MNKVVNNDSKLILEERKAVVLLIWMFYAVFITFEFFEYFFLPITQKKPPTISHGGLGIWYYIFVFLLLPVGIYWKKRGNPYFIKYLYFISFNSIDMINSILIYWGSNKPFESGSLVELFFVLFSPLFINKRYFYIVSIGLIGKYAVYGIIFSSTKMILPICILILIGIVAYVLLVRFLSYIKTLKIIHEDLRKKEKLAVIGQMAAAIGHEIRNPLASLKGFTQLQNERYPNTNDFYPIMIQEIDRINSIVNDLMHIGKPKALNFEKASIEEIIAYTLSIIQQQAERQNINIETTMKGPLPPLECDEKQLKQVFINLIKNAIEAMPDGGKIGINIKVLEEREMSISIQDEGCGIPEEKVINLGDPFFTTKKDGTGLGLMVTNQIIKDHNGKMEIESRVGKGTKIEVVLPIIQSRK